MSRKSSSSMMPLCEVHARRLDHAGPVRASSRMMFTVYLLLVVSRRIAVVPDVLAVRAYVRASLALLSSLFSSSRFLTFGCEFRSALTSAMVGSSPRLVDVGLRDDAGLHEVFGTSFASR